MIARDVGGAGGLAAKRLRPVLLAIADMISAHREEFEGLVEGYEVVAALAAI
jgi:hypothetical protein